MSEIDDAAMRIARAYAEAKGDCIRKGTKLDDLENPDFFRTLAKAALGRVNFLIGVEEGTWINPNHITKIDMVSTADGCSMRIDFIGGNAFCRGYSSATEANRVLAKIVASGEAE